MVFAKTILYSKVIDQDFLRRCDAKEFKLFVFIELLEYYQNIAEFNNPNTWNFLTHYH